MRGDFMSLINNNVNIYVNIFVHYPECYNSSVISRNVEKYFDEYFVENKVELKSNVYVMIHSAPCNEEEMIKITFTNSSSIYEIIKIEEENLKLKKELITLINNKITNIYFDN